MRERTNLEKIALLSLDISDIETEINGLYALKKQKKAEIAELRERMIEKARNGETPFRGEE